VGQFRLQNREKEAKHVNRPEEDQALERQRAHYEKMTGRPVKPLVVSLAVPSIISMLVSSVYNMADTYFVSQLGTSASGAVGIVFSIMAIIQAVGFCLGQGAGNIAARQLGAQRLEEASETASTGFFCALAFGGGLAMISVFGCTPLMRFLGATDTILPYAKAYGDYILLAAPIMCASFVMNNLLRGEGKSLLGMVGITVGGILNMALDPIFIFVLDQGTAGAAQATALSQCVSFVILLSMFLTGRSSVRLRISKVSRRLSVYRNIMTTGLPSLCRQGLASAGTILLNRAARMYGDPAVAAMGIVARIAMFMFSTILGFGQGYQPVAAFNYGARRFDRVREAARFSARVCTAVILVVSAACFLLAGPIITAFRPDDPEVIALGTFAFRAQCLMMPLTGVVTVTNMSLQCTGHSAKATFLALCRQGIYYIPLILVLPGVAEVTGVQLAQPISDFLTFVTSVPFYIWFLRHLKRMEQQEGSLCSTV